MVRYVGAQSLEVHLSHQVRFKGKHALTDETPRLIAGDCGGNGRYGDEDVPRGTANG